MTLDKALPTLHKDSELKYYLEQIRRFPILESEEEYMLAKRWREHTDLEAAHKLVTSHLRLVVKIAMGYRGYGLPLSDLIAEGNVGMMQAVKGFDPERGFRLATYAVWWIKSAIQGYILHSWSLVRLGTTAAQKKLFFNLRRIKRQIQANEDQPLSADQVKKIAQTLKVTEEEVISMNTRLERQDYSLNAPLTNTGQEDWQDWIEDQRETQETTLSEAQELDYRRSLLRKALQGLNERELTIITDRHLNEDSPASLQDLSKKLKISQERVRQIEVKAFEKIRKSVKNSARGY